MKRLAITLPLLLLLLGGVTYSTDIESQARDIEGKLMSPCCMSNTVAEHHSGIALEMRAGIRDMLRQGKTENEILAFYVDKHGEQVLAMPSARGFNLVAWLLPLVMLIGGPALLFLVLRGWRGRRKEAATETTEAAAPIDPEYARRLERRLAEMD